ncbi:Putative FKBP-type peptidyl-prolyl cis-trans isomerase [uncultured archaeon]|nr:Putative FKBP-type peptidyl-prolyl cis-trans isomerase [uncultured archaeon]
MPGKLLAQLKASPGKEMRKYKLGPGIGCRRSDEVYRFRMEFKMTVKNGDFIRIDYLESVEGQPIAATNKDVATEKGIFSEDAQYGPHLIVVGAGQLVKGFEEDLIGKEIGYSGTVEIPPENAFGLRDAKKIEIVPVNRFKEQKPVPGMRVGVEDKVGTVTRVIGRKVNVDFNHPLAGRTIVYEYKIIENIDDRQEKLKALVKTFARMELDSEIKDDVAIITVPWELSYYKEWLMIRRGVADMIIQHLGIKEVDYIEKHTGEKVKAELISPPGKEIAAEAESDAPASEQGSV